MTQGSCSGESGVGQPGAHGSASLAGRWTATPVRAHFELGGATGSRCAARDVPVCAPELRATSGALTASVVPTPYGVKPRDGGRSVCRITQPQSMPPAGGAMPRRAPRHPHAKRGSARQPGTVFPGRGGGWPGRRGAASASLSPPLQIEAENVPSGIPRLAEGTTGPVPPALDQARSRLARVQRQTGQRRARRMAANYRGAGH